MIIYRSNRSDHLFGLLLLCAFACDRQEGLQVVRREGNPDVVYTDDKLMDRAISNAQKTHTEFVRALEKRDPHHRNFSIKKPFLTPAGHNEHIWLTDVTWDGTKFNAVVGNKPVDVKDVHLGERISISPDRISDWMYLDDNRVIGGYTLRVLHYQRTQAEQKAFIEQTGLEIPRVDF